MAIDPMLANALEWDKLHKAIGYTMEPKLDGVRCIADCRTKDVKLWSRGGKELTEKVPPEMLEYLNFHAHGLILDGELGYDKFQDQADAFRVIDFNMTMRVIGSQPDEAKRKRIDYQYEFGQQMRLFVFDMLSEPMFGETTHLPQENRRALLETWARNGDIPIGWHRQEGYHPVGIVPSFSRYDATYYEHIVKIGGEGVILKNPKAQYYPGKRKAGTWYKLKAFDTIDVQVTGYTEGLGKYQGQIGAIEFNGGKCSGMDDATRADISRNKEQYIGRWFELRHFGRVGKNGDGYRFPQFLRWRDDLS